MLPETLPGSIAEKLRARLLRGDIGYLKRLPHGRSSGDLSDQSRSKERGLSRAWGIALPRAFVRATEAIARRAQGEPIETPKTIAPNAHVPPTGESLRAAFEGWRKARNPAAGTLAEYKRAVDLFVELHGDMPIVGIRKPHARAFREALQDIPRSRVGSLNDAAGSRSWQRGAKSIQRPLRSPRAP